MGIILKQEIINCKNNLSQFKNNQLVEPAQFFKILPNKFFPRKIASAFKGPLAFSASKLKFFIGTLQFVPSSCKQLFLVSFLYNFCSSFWCHCVYSLTTLRNYIHSLLLSPAVHQFSFRSYDWFLALFYGFHGNQRLNHKMRIRLPLSLTNYTHEKFTNHLKSPRGLKSLSSSLNIPRSSLYQ